MGYLTNSEAVITGSNPVGTPRKCSAPEPNLVVQRSSDLMRVARKSVKSCALGSGIFVGGNTACTGTSGVSNSVRSPLPSFGDN